MSTRHCRRFQGRRGDGGRVGRSASPLRTCIAFCEVECVVGCCGIDAVSTDPDLIEDWCHQVGSAAVVEARLQLIELIEVVEDRSRCVTSDFLNHRTHDERAA
ncbi:DUF6331 family protein [Micromonospora sp. BRA006-A]|nr:DUF6331 family protein [Micromonospora sp. BRA006-A]